MTTTPLQRERLAAHRLGRETMLRLLANAEAALQPTDENPYAALDSSAVQRERRRLARLAESFPIDQRRAFLGGVAEGVRHHRKPSRFGRPAPFGALTERGIVKAVKELVESGFGIEKAATIHAAKLAEDRRRTGAGIVMKAPAIRALWQRRNSR